MALTLIALALPTAALANSVDFTTGMFISGTVTRTAHGGFTMPSFTVTVVGTLDTIIVSTSTLSNGCNTAGTGTCTFGSGTLTVKSPGGGVVFTDSLVNGTIIKTPRGGVISATFLPNAMTTTAGFVQLTISFGHHHPISNNLLGGTGVAVSNSTGVIPEPSTLLSFGTGLIGIAEMMRRKRKLKLRT
jgi:hypothetical protein